MSRLRSTRLLLWLIPLLVLLAVALRYRAREPARPEAGRPWDADQRVTDIFVDGPPLTIHDKTEGWGECPCLAVSPDYAYVAYDVRRGNLSQLYVCEIPRGQERPRIRKIPIDQGGDSEFKPAIALSRREGLWVAWDSYRDRRWSVWACRVEGMEAGRPVRISSDEGFNSQVKACAGDACVWFVWTEWKTDGYRVMARRLYGGRLEEPLNVREAPEPVGRPDLAILDDGHVVFVWDEFSGDRWSIRMRELKSGRLREVETLAEGADANHWEPHVAGVGDPPIVTWHSVPFMNDKCRPAAGLPGKVCMTEGIDRPEDDETWRVSCFRDGTGQDWLIWATRHGHRRTSLYLRRMSEKSLSRTCSLVFPMKRTFINTFDCLCHGKLTLAYEHSGSVFLYELDLPDPPEVGMPPEARASSKGDFEDRDAGKPDIDYATCYAGDSLRLYFGDDHNHTCYSDGRAYPDISMTLARRWRNLDFMAITDHDITLTPGEFAWMSAASAMLTDEGRFVCIPGLEEGWGWARDKYGHWTVLFPHEGELLLFEDGMVPADLFAFGRKHDAILIPHHVGISWAAYDWDHFDPVVEPVVEVCSKHGIFECYEEYDAPQGGAPGSFIQDGLARGLRFGLIGASDSHNCFKAMYTETGLMGVYAPRLSKQAIMGAIRKRRTYALTGGNIIIDFRCNGKMMGETLHRSDLLFFTGYAASPEGIEAVELVSGGRVVHREEVGAPEFDLSLRLDAPRQETYYYLRARTPSGNRAWSSPVWIIP